MLGVCYADAFFYLAFDCSHAVCYTKEKIQEVIKIKGNRKKIVLQGMLAVLIIGVLVYTFRGQVRPIAKQLSETSPLIICAVSVCALLYNVIEGGILQSLARCHKADFKLSEGIGCSLCSAFYRVATMGSGSGIASIVYLDRRGVPVSDASGFYTMHYMFHKLSTVICAMALFFINIRFMRHYYKEYFHLLWAGCLLVLLICAGIIVVCCWGRLHMFAIRILYNIDRKRRFTDKILMLEGFFETVEKAAGRVLKDKKLVGSLILRDVLKNMAWYVIPYLLLGKGVGLHIWETAGITALSVVLASVIPSPAGIGSTEVMCAALFSVFTGTARAGAIALLYRFATFVVPFLAGGIVTGYNYVHVRRKNHADAAYYEREGEQNG